MGHSADALVNVIRTGHRHRWRSSRRTDQTNLRGNALRRLGRRVLVVGTLVPLSLTIAPSFAAAGSDTSTRPALPPVDLCPILAGLQLDALLCPAPAPTDPPTTTSPPTSAPGSTTPATTAPPASSTSEPSNHLPIAGDILQASRFPTRSTMSPPASLRS